MEIVISFTPQSLYSQRKVPNTLWIGEWVCSRASLDTAEKRKVSCLRQESNPGFQPVACHYNDSYPCYISKNVRNKNYGNGYSRKILAMNENCYEW
jgi:hypothetical protein